MMPTREEAEALLREAEKCNPGPWGNHSRVAAHCAERIAQECGDMDADKAYILGLLHDIGRKFGVRHLGHVSDGYSYMMSLGYDEAAKICLTHSFQSKVLTEYIGKFDTTEEELNMIQDGLETVALDEYDRLIQLCDSMAGAEGVLDMEERMGDVKRRYGAYPQDKWDFNLGLKRSFEEKMGRDIYDVVEKDTFCIGADVKKQAEFFYQNANAPVPNRPNLVGVTVLIEFKNKLLLEHRADSERWAVIGGSLRADESFLDCALRETMEETGIALARDMVGPYKLYDDPSIIISYPDGNVFRSIMMVYRTKLQELPKLSCSKESRELRFFTKEELSDIPIVETHIPILQDYLESNVIHLSCSQCQERCF